MEPLDPAFVRSACLALHVRRAARTLGRAYDDALRPVGLNNGQFSVLTMLAGESGWSMQTLADALDLDQSSLTAALKPLRRRGLVGVSPGEEDRRRRLLALTQDGQALLLAAAPLWRGAQAKAEAALRGRSVDALRRDLAALANPKETLE